MRARVFGPALCSSLVLLAGCGGSSPTSPSGGNPPPSQSIAAVHIQPSADTAVSLGESISFSAAATDASGQNVSGATFSWASTSPAVATVSSSGQATTKANGTTRIVASASGKADTATLLVRQVVAAVQVQPDSASLVGAGDTARFSASARDANAQVVTGATLTWSVSDTTVASVDSAGLVTARTAGRVSVVARATDVGVADSAALRVTSLAAPQIQSVSPTPLRAGQSATITGQNFAAAAGDTVTIDGLPASVSSASATSLQVQVPTYDCLPARTVAVRVSTAGGAAELQSSLDPAQSTLSLGVGQQAVITDPASFCIQFPPSSSNERYIVGVQSLDSVASSLTPVSITAEAANGSGAADVATLSLAPQTQRLAGGGSAIPRQNTDLGQRRADAILRQWERTHLDPAASIPARGGSSGPRPLLSISGSASAGDTVQLRVPTLGSANLCTTYTPITAVVQAIGTRAIIVADTANPANGFTQADYQGLSDALDNKIFATDVSYFGQPTDMDGNGHIVIAFTAAVNNIDPAITGGTVGGFVWGGDFFSRSSCPASDEGEVYYGRVPDPTGIYYQASTRSQELANAESTMAHELVHLLQNSYRMPAGLPFMNSSMAEAQAVLGEEVVGHAVTGRQPYQNYGYAVAFNTAGTDSISWYAGEAMDLFYYFGFKNSTTRIDGAPEQCGWWQQDPSPCTDRPLWYGIGWSFLRWLSDRYGPAYPGGEQGLQQAIIKDPGTGPQIASDVVGVPLSTLMAEWSAALYVDDRVPGADPALTFSSWNLYDFEQNTVATAHLQPLEAPFGDWTASGDVRASSTGYLAISGLSHLATAVKVRGSGGGLLPSGMQIWIVRAQ